MKTIKEWFESVENPILRKVLLMRLNEYNEKGSTNSLLNAIYSALCVFKSIEGFRFWNDVYNELKKHNESPTFNAKYPVMQVDWLDENECIYCKTKEERDLIVEILKHSNLFYGKIGNIHTFESYYIINGKSSHISLFKPENYTIYPAKLFMKNDLLNEAKRRFPIGCRINQHFGIRKIHHQDFRFVRTTNSIAADSDGTNVTMLYENNQWAEYVEVYGFKVGDIIEADIVREWCLNGDNLLSVNWTKYHIGYFWKEPFKIDKIAYLDNHVAFKLSGMNWIKAEGLREFIELEKLKQDVKEAEKQFIECCNELKLKQTLNLLNGIFIKDNKNVNLHITINVN